MGLVGGDTEIGGLVGGGEEMGEGKDRVRLQKLGEIGQVGRGLAVLARYAELSRRLYNAPDARSLISMKWEKTLLQSTTKV